jgi:hypothetical protein
VENKKINDKIENYYNLDIKIREESFLESNMQYKNLDIIEKDNEICKIEMVKDNVCEMFVEE